MKNRLCVPFSVFARLPFTKPSSPSLSARTLNTNVLAINHVNRSKRMNSGQSGPGLIHDCRSVREGQVKQRTGPGRARTEQDSAMRHTDWQPDPVQDNWFIAGKGGINVSAG